MSIKSFAATAKPRHAAAMNEHEAAIEDARQAGIDLDLIDTNLALPIEERWRQHAGALELVLELERARIARDAGLQPTAPTPR